MDPMMMLVVGWTLVGGFVFTTIVTCLSLVGVIKFADKKQQQKLFAVLVVELLVGVGAKVLGAATLDQAGVAHTIGETGRNAGIAEVVSVLAEPTTAGAPTIDRAQLDTVANLFRPVPGTVMAKDISDLRAKIQQLPAGTVKHEDVKTLKNTEIIKKLPVMSREFRTQ